METDTPTESPEGTNSRRVEACAAPVCSGPNAEQITALRAASDILQSEANELASYMEKTLKTTLTLRTQEIVTIDALTPHRVVIAVRNEMQRLRDISTTLLGMLPKDSDDD